MPDRGEVTIKLNGEPVTLKCTMRACEQVDAVFGDFPTAMNKIGSMSFASFVAIVAIGLGKKQAEVKDDVFATGMPPLVDPLLEYLGLLANGGRPPEARKDDAPGEA
jgi:hypothetical protein